MTELSVDYDIRIDPANVGDHQLWSFGRKTNCDGTANGDYAGSIFGVQHDADAHGPERHDADHGLERPAVDDLRAARRRVEAPDLHPAAQRQRDELDRHPLRGRRRDRPHDQPDASPPTVNAAGTNCNFLGRAQTPTLLRAARDAAQLPRLRPRRSPRTRRSPSPSRRAWRACSDDAAAIDLGLTSAIVDNIDLPKFGIEGRFADHLDDLQPGRGHRGRRHHPPGARPARGHRDADRQADQGPRGRHARHHDHRAGAVPRRRVRRPRHRRPDAHRARRHPRQHHAARRGRVGLGDHLVGELADRHPDRRGARARPTAGPTSRSR